ncbi:transaldolase [Dactylosporangium matsuzakiense]|uniref:Transaldolase n=2 Tax=Dactylosporangium matsuzakiense TaxID=53360 RepID=A0A9W6NNK1_9ACTN|nr:transaldolase [Dactylosporangium matsuzakiense]GLL03401.1 transaldolase [Dactylosporangium matsuzakiense]
MHPASDPLLELSAAGVSVWLDDLSRELLAGGELEALIRDKHVVGVTSNPTIFASALSKGDRYNEQLRDLAATGTGLDDAIFAITTHDVRSACRVLRPVYEQTDGVDGRVSIEVDPRLARDTEATIVQALALWRAVGEPNLFVKIPATIEGLAAITAVTAQGISVNVTLIFSLERYRRVMDVYMRGLEAAARAGHELSAIHGVASFFVSRVDTEVDARLGGVADPAATALEGRAAVANARLAFEAYEQVATGERWQALAAAGARPQRPLWASTGVKSPAYADTMYVSELVVRGTVNTMPGATLMAFADHGVVTGDTVHGTYDDARDRLAALQRLGIDFDEVTELLEREGLAKFEASWDELGATVRRELRDAAPTAARIGSA